MTAGRDAAIQAAKDSIAAEKVEQDRALAQKMLFDAKRENVKLQLESAYREQLVKVYNEVNSHKYSACNVFFSNSFMFLCILKKNRPSVALITK